MRVQYVIRMYVRGNAAEMNILLHPASACVRAGAAAWRATPYGLCNCVNDAPGDLPRAEALYIFWGHRP